MVAAETIEKVRGYLEGLRTAGFEVSFGVLFGSHARGENHLWSDIDLLVVSPRFDAGPARDDVDRLWLATLDADVRIEPVPCGLVEWREDEARPLVEIARREGYKVELHANHAAPYTESR
jgi:predicted nucleotidyltransferase